MKKIIFLFAMVLAVSIAMAQTGNVSVVDQDGNTNEAVIKQIGASNNATAVQLGNLNEASALQTGSSNEAIVAQLNGNSNKGSVEQAGASNYANLVQGLIPTRYDLLVPGEAPVINVTIAASNNNSSIDQIGDGNYGEVAQMGNDNSSTIEQTGDDNEAEIQAGWMGYVWGAPTVIGHRNIASVQQIGDDNISGIWAYGSDNAASNIQNGMSNFSQISQGYPYSGLYRVYNVRFNVARLTQAGNINGVRLMQLGNTNLFKLNQNGDNNHVGGYLGTGMDTYFKQFGDNNRFAGVVKNSANNLSFNKNLYAEQNNGATLDTESIQKGDSNDIGLRQGQDDWALIQQVGIGNEALLWQQGAPAHEATIMQLGNSNMASVLQSN